MRAQHEREEAERWIGFGLNDCAVARLTGIPRTTVRDWRRDTGRTWTPQRPNCPRCSDAALDERAYAYLLGIYLGDGHIAKAPRFYSLRVTLDRRYSGIITECCSALETVKGSGTRAYVLQREGCVVVSLGWMHWPCLFPQHGVGPKHLRRIELQTWQRNIVETFPGLFLRGLIHSDGWRGTNRVVVRGKTYRYPRYQFVNYSPDIRALFCRACDAYGVAWRQMNRTTISIARRDDVLKLDRVVGPKT